LAVADFNGDGRPDLAVTIDSGTSVLLANSDGTFQAAVNYNGAGHHVPLAVGDFDGDGKIDLAVASFSTYTNGSVSVLLGRGDGTFQKGVTHSLGTRPVFVAAGDFNGDGKLDLAVANAYVPATCPDWGLPFPSGPLAYSSVSVLLGNGDGTFQTALSSDPRGNPRSIAVGDFNGDGKLDLAVANPDFPVPPCGLDDDLGGISVLLGKGDGTFQAAGAYNAGRFPQSVAVADFDGDGKPDLIVANYGSLSVSVLLGKGDGTFQDAISFNVGGPPQSVVVGDFNGDGKPDLATAEWDYGVSVLLNACVSTSIPLAIVRSNATLTISWPLPATDFILESTTCLILTNWQTAVESLTTNNGRCEVTVPRDQEQRYFRLHKP
jgi:hypothetical protein